MKQKSLGLGTFLGFFVLGLFYAFGFTKKGVGYVVVLTALSWIISTFISPSFAIIINIAGAYLAYKEIQEFNANLENGIVPQEDSIDPESKTD